MEKSNKVKSTSIGKGQTIVRSFPMDNINECKLPDTMGGSLGGSDTNLSHSLSGASSVAADGLGTKG